MRIVHYIDWDAMCLQEATYGVRTLALNIYIWTLVFSAMNSAVGKWALSIVMFGASIAMVALKVQQQ